MAKSTATKKKAPAPKAVTPKKIVSLRDKKLTTKGVAVLNKMREVKPTVQAPVSTSQYAIDDNIPIPSRPFRKGRVSPYPYASLEVGQSFFVPAEIEKALYTNEKEAAEAQREEYRVVANRLSGGTRRFAKRNPGYRFAVRTVEGGIRVWRIEEGKGE